MELADLELTWHKLPLHFRQSVVGKLRYKDRCSLQKCSKTDHYTVEISKLSLQDVAILVCSEYTLFSFSDDDSGDTVFLVKYFKKSDEENQVKIEFMESPRHYKPGKNQKIISKKTKILENVPENLKDLDLAIGDFLRAVKKLKVNKITINEPIIPDYHPEADGARTLEFKKQLLNSLETRKTLKIQATTLKLKWHSNQQEVLDILSHFQPGTLRKIEFSHRKATWQMSQIAESEQWKQAKEVFLEVKTDLNVEDLSHFDEVQAHVSDLSAQDVWKVIQNYLQNPIPGASFHFSYQDTNPDLQRILEQFNVTPFNQPIQPHNQLRTVLCRRFLFTQRFPMPSGLVLVVLIAEKEVLGTVCNADFINTEVKVEMGLIR